MSEIGQISKHGEWSYFASIHLKHGPHVDPEVYGEIPESKPVDDYERWRGRWSEMSTRKCGYGMGTLRFDLNGIKRTLFMCPTAMDSLMSRHRHGDFYMECVEGVAALESEPIDIVWGDRFERWVLSYYYEDVISWGFNNHLKNKVTASSFITLLHMGRWQDAGHHYRESFYAEKLLEAVGKTKGDNPIKKCAKVFSDPIELGLLLAAIANEQTKLKY